MSEISKSLVKELNEGKENYVDELTIIFEIRDQDGRVLFYQEILAGPERLAMKLDGMVKHVIASYTGKDFDVILEARNQDGAVVFFQEILTERDPLAPRLSSLTSHVIETFGQKQSSV